MREQKDGKRPPIRTVMKAIERATRIRARQTRQSMAIENCQCEFQCPGRWSALTDDGKLDSRFCETCKSRVHLCVTHAERRAHAAAGHCVVVYRDLWPSGHTVLRGRRKELEGKAPREALRAMGLPVRSRS